METKKFYVYRIHIKSGRKEYRRTKCLDKWASEKCRYLCWKFSKQGAKNIVEQETQIDKARFYEYGMERVQ